MESLQIGSDAPCGCGVKGNLLRTIMAQTSCWGQHITDWSQMRSLLPAIETPFCIQCSESPGSMEMTGEQLQAWVASILAEEFDLKAFEIRELGRQHNNFTFLVQLHKATQSPRIQRTARPGTVPMPAQTHRLVFQTPHPDSSLESSIVIENKVAMMQVARQAIVVEGVRLVPEVFGWSSSAEEGSGWLLEEYKEGANFSEDFPALEIDSKQKLLRQLAVIVHRLQSIELPESFHGYGGAGFDHSGNVVSKAMSTGAGGPFISMVELYTSTLRRQLEKSDSSALLDGWRLDGLRARLEKFCHGGITGLIEDHTAPRSIVHAELCFQNLLFNPSTLTATALLDFELSHVATPVEEFLYSFHDTYGLLAGPYGESKEELELRNALLEGFPSTLPTSLPHSKVIRQFGTERHVQWEVAKLWDDELERAGALRPRTLSFSDKTSQLHWFVEQVCPFYVLQSRWLASRNEAQLAETRSQCKEIVEHYLMQRGF